MSVYKKKNGKWYCRFQLDGERHHLLCKTATTKTEALIEEAEYKTGAIAIQRGYAQPEATLSQVFELYLEYSRVNKKTYDHDISRTNLLKQIWKNKKYAKDIKANDIENLKIVLLNMGRNKTTVNRYLQIVSRMYNIAIANGITEYNPMRFCKKFPEKNRQIRYLLPNEEIELYKYANELWSGYILVALNSGLRLSNIRLLQRKHINLEFRIFNITENKSNKHIKLYINDVLYSYFKEKLANMSPNDYVFTKNNKPLTMNQFQRQWDTLRNRAGVPDLRFHDLRHTVGTRLAKQGTPINVIKEIMTHSNIQTTMGYIHFANEQLQDAMNCLVFNSND